MIYAFGFAFKTGCDIEIDIPGGDGEKTLKDALHGIILWQKRYIVIILKNDGSPRDHLESGQPSSPVPSSALPALSPSPQQPNDNSGERSSSDHDDDIPPNSPQQPFATSSQAQSFKSVQPPKKKRKRSAKKKPEAKTDEETKGSIQKEVKDFFEKAKERRKQEELEVKKMKVARRDSRLSFTIRKQKGQGNRR
jgi:hypothetical protein